MVNKIDGEVNLSRLLIIGVVAVVLLIAAYGGLVLVLSWPVSFGNIDKAGVFGDSFGLLTSLFSGLAFSGIIFTIFLQREELRLQRKELQETREVMKGQSFESTFFQMLRLHNDIVNSIDLTRGDRSPHTGRDCFAIFYQRLKQNYQRIKNRDGRDEDELIFESYGNFWKDHQTELGHYFRYLYTILKFIQKSDVEDKKLYSNIVRAQLSDQELLIIFYNCLNIYGVEKFKPLAEEFALFDNLPKEHLLHHKHIDFFAASAFG